MGVTIERGNKKRKSVGFTNFLGLLIMAFLAFGLAGGFCLAVLSIKHQYMGALACYTAVFAPIGTATGIVLNSIVRKSDHENTGANGEGIKFAAAKAVGFIQTEDSGIEDSPEI